MNLIMILVYRQRFHFGHDLQLAHEVPSVTKNLRDLVDKCSHIHCGYDWFRIVPELTKHVFHCSLKMEINLLQIGNDTGRLEYPTYRFPPLRYLSSCYSL